MRQGFVGSVFNCQSLITCWSGLHIKAVTSGHCGSPLTRRPTLRPGTGHRRVGPISWVCVEHTSQVLQEPCPVSPCVTSTAYPGNTRAVASVLASMPANSLLPEVCREHSSRPSPLSCSINLSPPLLRGIAEKGYTFYDSAFCVFHGC